MGSLEQSQKRLQDPNRQRTFCTMALQGQEFSASHSTARIILWGRKDD